MIYLFSFFPIDIPEPPKVDVGEIINASQENQSSTFNTYSDNSYSNPEVNFSSGQTVYVKVDIGSDKDAEAVINLLDMYKEKVFDISSSRNGILYFATFSAPRDGGTYYVHVEIKGEGLSFSGERNINVVDNTDVSNENEENQIVVSDIKAESDSYTQENNAVNENSNQDTSQTTFEQELHENNIFQIIWNYWQKLIDKFFG